MLRWSMAKPDTTMTITEFKAKCLRLVDELDSSGIVLTKRGRPVARVIPAGATSNRDLIGSLKGKVVVHGHIMSTGVKWRAES
ncbi:MAG: type II toxin-antitoxin system prevent-host-death family antitoxin [Acidobacteriota bacterium]